MTSSAPVYDNTQGNTGAIIQVLGGGYGKRYSIYIDGDLKASYRPPNGSNPNDAQFAATDAIAFRLVQGLQGAPGTVSNADGDLSELVSTGYCATWLVAVQGDIIYLKSPSSTPFTLSVSDGAGGVNFKACTDTVSAISDLPRLAPHYYAVRIAENSDEQKDLWFKFIVSEFENSITPSIGFGKAGYWKEAVAPHTNTAFDPATMPHKLTYNSTDGVFIFSREAYSPRAVGTEVSSASPSFVGSSINDVSTFQGRTVFLSGSNIVMSRTNKPTNFWRGSASALADTDPIDINSTVESSQMLAAVQFNKDLVMFTRKAQHVVFGRTALTPNNAALVMTTKFESEPGAHPVSAGRNVFFASNFGRFTGVREFFTEASASDSNDSRLVTQHVNKYLVGKAKLLTVSANYETLLVHTDAEQNDFYVYQYIWSDDKKIQSAWSKWKFPHDIVHSFFDEDVMYLVQRIGNDHYLLRMPLDVQDNDGIGYAVYLDQRFDVFDCDTQFVLPLNYLADEELVCVQGEGCPTPGLITPVKSIDDVPGTGKVVTLKHSMNGGSLLVGTRFKSRYMPTMPSVKDQSGVVIGTAKTRARAFLVTLSDTGEITGVTRSKYGDGEEVTFNARVVGDIDNVVGEQPLSNEQFKMPFRHDVNNAEIELFTDSHLPMTISDIEYVGQYTKRGRRIANSGGKE
jgi:hypothetical protein